MVERSYADIIEVPLEIERSKMSQKHRLMAKYRAVPLVWQASETDDASIVFGYFREWRVDVSYPTTCKSTIEIEGLN